MPWADLDEIKQRHAGMQGGFCLLANVKKIAIDEPFEVAPGVILRPAKENETLSIRQLLRYAARQDNPVFGYRNPYETRLENESVSPDLSRIHTHSLLTEEYRYCVAEYTRTNVTLYRTFEVSALTLSELEPGIDISGNLAGFEFGYSFGNQQRILKEASENDECLLTLELSHLEDLKNVFAKFQKHRDEGIGLSPALRQFKELHAIPPSSPLRFLGYVAILESLITHQPDKKDPYDSLTRQVRQKMLLIGRRSQLKLPYERFGPDCNPETLWTKIYAYRSAVAHGVPIDFKGKFQMLGSAKQALDFIRDSTAAIMRHALDEPELVSDLRAC